MTYVHAKSAEQRTPSVRKAERSRDEKRRKRRTSSGRPGRKSQETRRIQAEAINALRNRNTNFLTEIELPNLTSQKRDITNILLQPEADVLTNKQIASLAGVCPKTVSDFRGSPEYYESLATSDIFERRLVRLEAQALSGLERNITAHGDNTSIKMVLVMRQRLDEAHRNVFNISADTIQIGVGQTLKNLPAQPKPQMIQEAEYEVEGSAETGDKQEQ